jgi:two-component system chemotaxis response regulator CheB
MKSDMGGHDIIVIGASLGGVSALKTVVGGLPSDLAAAVLVVLHVDPRSTEMLAGILASAGKLKAAPAVDGEPIAFGQVRVAPPDYHLMIARDRMIVVHGPKENRSRPAIDTLFRSAARAYGSRVIGVILTGKLDDGTAGLWAIKRAGGIAVVQDPKDAQFPDMPKNASDGVDVDHSVPLKDMARLLAKLTAVPAVESEAKMDEERDVPGVVYVCPDCNGPLREIKIGNEKLVRFRCLVGHAFSMMTLLEGHAEAREAALWSAVVALEHEAMFAERAAKQALTRNEPDGAAALTQEAARARDQGKVIRELLTLNPSRSGGDPTSPLEP